MILVDTSIWIDFFRQGNTELEHLLSETLVLCHPFVIGELACGNLNKRSEVLSLMNDLPAAIFASHQEVLTLIERRELMARGIGFIDAHLIASTVLTPSARIWTRDRRLSDIAIELDLIKA